MQTPYLDPLHQARGHVEVIDRTLIVPSPAPGADWSAVVPGHEGWEILSATAVLTASAAVATRSPQLILDDQSSTYFAEWAGGTVVASASQRFVFARLGFAAATVAGQPITQPVPQGLILPPGHRVRMVTALLDVADQWSGVVLFLRVRTLRGRAAQLEYDQQFSLELAESIVGNPDLA